MGTNYIVNGTKALLVLGVGLGGHQIYWKVAGNYLDDGFFYFADKMSMIDNSLLPKNKVYNSDSAITKVEEYVKEKDWMKDYYSYHVDFQSNSGVRDKLNTLAFNGFKDKASVYKIIKDHSLKLSMPCQSGTGWLLDFELPKNGQYPTKWFIATNLHVINKFRFKENPYKVVLPITESSVRYHVPSQFGLMGRALTSCEASIYNNTSELSLYTERDADDRNIYPEDTRYVELFRRQGVRNAEELVHLYKALGYIKEPNIYTTTIKNPKLVYAAVDFLGPRYTVSGHKVSEVGYFKDFGVMEVDFANENQARIMTNGIYDKYYKNNPAVKENNGQLTKIDFFAPELMSKYSANELANLEDRYYIGGYPGGVAENLSFEVNTKLKVSKPAHYGFFNYYHYDTELTDSKLTYFKKHRGNNELTFNLLNSKGQIIPGHSDIDSIDKVTNSSKIVWDGKELNGWGYNYLIDNSFLGKGASGSMVLNQKGELLGLYRMYNEGFNYGFVEPLRASWVIDEKGRIILPGFDLLTGSGRQEISYKSQLERFNPNLTTYLRHNSWSSNVQTV
ncbi:hypothetical protein DNK47_00690 [Mycoplasma wenyonii]|uniref:DUF31 domain-containing protein n=1 Tax=Mycoplasma wenyonii TaxID=65123 RepID=A0A328PKG1_9MOLU|nr:hypothetical protein [Mycoplasma wenyonii]RAO95352.1 hypothetical protein DNK47_00690 [Mycoplasma wenyonii]